VRIGVDASIEQAPTTSPTYPVPTTATFIRFARRCT
jgi:hypothetical protein